MPYGLRRPIASVLAATAVQAQTADVTYTNAGVYPVDAAHPRAQGFAIMDGNLSVAEVLEYQGLGSELKGPAS